MSKKVFHDPQHWYDRAEDARNVAAEILDPISRRTMLDVAERYESLARRTTEQLQSQKPNRLHGEHVAVQVDH